MKNNNKAVVALKAVHDVRNTQWKMKGEQDGILEKNKLFYEGEKTEEIVWDKLSDGINIDLESDIGSIKLFNQVVSEYKNPLPYGVRFNKMVPILEMVLECSRQDENFILDLAQGKMPKDFDNNIEAGKLPLLGSNEFWGSSKSTILSTAATYVNMVINEQFLNETLDLQKSSIAHAFELPDLFQTESVNNYIYDHEQKKYFSFFHSGYSFGGSRGDKKEFGPQDCGTIIENYYLTNKLAPQCTATTADLLCIHYSHIKPTHKSIRSDWSGRPELVKIFSVNKDKDDAIGSIYFWRNFNEKYPEATTLGSSGHTAIILGQNNEHEFVTIGVNRDMPKIEGFGLQSFSIDNKQENQKSFILDPTDLVLSQEEFKGFSDIHYTGLSDLAGVVNYFDEQLNII